MKDQQFDEAVFYYVRDLVRKNGTIMMTIGALTLFVGLNAVLIFTRGSAGSALLMVLGAIFLPLAYQRWFRNFFQLARFSVDVERNYHVVGVGIAPLEDASRFEAIPRCYIDNPDDPALLSSLDELREMAQIFPDLRDKLEQCESAHGAVTRYDAANLNLLLEGLRAAKMPEYRYHLAQPESDAAKAHARNPTPRS